MTAVFRSAAGIAAVIISCTLVGFTDSGCGGSGTGSDAEPDADDDFSAMDSDGGETDRDAARDIDTSRRDVPTDAETPDWLTLPGVCGDGVIDPGEECDDGNRENGDDCDWLCHSGPGEFEYPPPDESLPPIVAAGPPLEVVSLDEGMEPLPVWMQDRLRLAYGSDVFGLAYPVTVPRPQTRFRTLRMDGSPGAGPWTHEEEWGDFGVHLMWAGGVFALFGAGRAESGAWMVRLDVLATAVSPVRSVLEASREQPFLALREVAWNGSRYGTFVSTGSDVESAPFILLALSADGDTGRVSDAMPRDFFASTGLPVFVGTAAGFAVADPKRIVAFDHELNLVGWSGYLPASAHPPWAANTVALDTGDGVLLLWDAWRAGAPTGPLDLWAARVDYAGSLTLPPRIVLPGRMAGDASSRAVRAAWGSAGAILVYWDGSVAESRPIRAINTDRWGNPRSESQDLPLSDPGPGSSIGGLAVAADEDGYGVVAQVDLDSAPRLVFWRLTPDPTYVPPVP